MSKAIAEDLVYSYRDKLAITIVRPSVVCSSHLDPEEGFIEGFQVTISLLIPHLILNV
jgi:nucleoside-diphosphate-sugar epimerase